MHFGWVCFAIFNVQWVHTRTPGWVIFKFPKKQFSARSNKSPVRRICSIDLTATTKVEKRRLKHTLIMPKCKYSIIYASTSRFRTSVSQLKWFETNFAISSDTIIRLLKYLLHSKNIVHFKLLPYVPLVSRTLTHTIHAHLTVSF